jgi:RNA polymerase sigma factor (sigma-70 family)
MHRAGWPFTRAGAAFLRAQSDERLIALTRAGNERAFEAIVHRYRGPLLRYCSRILPPGRAEDAVQQTFLNAFNAIANGERDLSLRPWLYRVAHNSALNLLRQNGWNHEQLDEQFDGVLRPDQAVEARERIRSLVAAVKGLPERQRDAIVLRELEGRSYEEIATALGVTDGAVRQLLNRARNTLRAGATALTPYGLAARIAAAASGGGTVVSERIAEITAGAGGVATLAKVGAAVLVAGAVATGAADNGVPGVGGSPQRAGVTDAAAAGGSGAPGRTGNGNTANRVGELGRGGSASGGHRGNAERHHSGRSSHSGGEGSGGGEHGELVSGHDGGGGSSGSGDRSGSGSSGSGSSGSGDRSGSGDSGSGSSGTSGGSDGGPGPSTSSGDSSSGVSGGGSPDGGSSGSSTPTTTSGSGDPMTVTTDSGGDGSSGTSH